MAKQKPITEEMELTEAIAISRTFPLDTLLKNFQATAQGLVTVWRSAEEALAVCTDELTMPRMLEFLIDEVRVRGNSTWFGPIK